MRDGSPPRTTGRRLPHVSTTHERSALVRQCVKPAAVSWQASGLEDAPARLCLASTPRELSTAITQLGQELHQHPPPRALTSQAHTHNTAPRSRRQPATPQLPLTVPHNLNRGQPTTPTDPQRTTALVAYNPEPQLGNGTAPPSGDISAPTAVTPAVRGVSHPGPPSLCSPG